MAAVPLIALIYCALCVVVFVKPTSSSRSIEMGVDFSSLGIKVT
jgi:hypothetical protein